MTAILKCYLRLSWGYVVCAFGLQKKFLPYPLNGKSSENGSRNCFGQKILARSLAFLVLMLCTVV